MGATRDLPRDVFVVGARLHVPVSLSASLSLTCPQFRMTERPHMYPGLRGAGGFFGGQKSVYLGSLVLARGLLENHGIWPLKASSMGRPYGSDEGGE